MTKKVLLVGLLLALISTFVFADDLSEFKNEREQLQNKLVQYQQITQNIQKRLIELNGLIRYLGNQKAKEELKPKEEEPPK